MLKRPLRYGMVGGSLGAFIGDVHRRAIAFESDAQLVAGCFSRNPTTNQKTAEAYGATRVYADFEEMAREEGAREDHIDFVVIVAPNSTHYPAAKAFLLQGIHVICEKPLCFTPEEAEDLSQAARGRGMLFGVTYTYSGYPMVKFARQLIQEGKLGRIVNVSAEYLQDWLLDDLAAGDNEATKKKVWRMHPEYAGISCCIGDIGTHIHHTAAYITNMRVKRLAAKVDRYGFDLDLNANILVEYENGCSGTYTCSQVCAGHLNGLSVRVFGTKGALEWRLDAPESLRVTRLGQPTQIYEQGTPAVYGRASELTRLPSGLSEGYYLAFANLYKAFLAAVAKNVTGEPPTPEDMDFPTLWDGMSGVKFVHAAMASDQNGSQFVELK